MGKEFIAGVSFADNAAQVAVLKLHRGNITVVHLEEYKSGSKDDLWFLESFRRKESKIFKKLSKVSVALDGSMLLQHSFPMDSTLSEDDRREHILWEMSNFLPGKSPGEHALDARVLREGSTEGVTEMFVASASRPYILRIAEELEDHNYELQIVDTIYFAGQYSLAVNYPELQKNIALASVGEQRVDAGILEEGNLVSFRSFTGASPVERAEQLVHFMREEEVNSAQIFGSGCSFGFIKTLQGNGNVEVTKMNPFRRVQMSSDLVDSGMARGQEHRFASCVGIALRKE
ncbi:MAG TPA: hypothetical protein VL633_12115 [Bacteroidota bacterium]|nr:hypothetical protein [Bacteroidota bacterium]